MSFPATHPALARALADRQYTVPTDVQTAVAAPEAQGRDLLVSAQTGSGKTVAFGLAMAPRVLGDAEKLPRGEAPRALIIAPTRELALQVQRELVWLYAETGARIVTCVGGMDARAEARALDQGAHIVVGTPGRLRDHLERRRLDLSALAVAVLDEADEMLDLGFREDLEIILDATPEDRQTLLFSATMPREIETLAERYQRDRFRIETLRRNEQHADIEYLAVRVAPFDVENAVVNLLRFHEAAGAIVFCATREAVKRMHARLLERGFAAVALSGELTQAERSSALQALRDGRARVLVATDVAARGLDIADLTLVIHAELPNDGETLLHRSGRTGRAGKKGLSVLVVPYNRRRRAEMLIGRARLKVSWGVPPAPEAIRARDLERFLADPMFGETGSEDETELVSRLSSAHSAEAIALALVRMHRAGLPAPEELSEDKGPPPRREFGRERPQFDRRDGGEDRKRPRFEKREGGERGRSEHGGSERGGSERASFERGGSDKPMTWFRLNIGRERNADPRWLLPIICKAGKISKSDVGAIRILDRETRFEITAEVSDVFFERTQSAEIKEGRISRVDSQASEGRSERASPHGERDSEPRGDRTHSASRPAERKAKKPFHRGQDKSGPHGGKSGKSSGFGKARDRESYAGRRGPEGEHASSGGRPVSKYKAKAKPRDRRPPLS